MKVVVQKGVNARVVVKEEVVGKIDKGLVLLVGFTKGDNIDKIKSIAKKIVNLRIFNDENGVMNLSLLDVSGSILCVSQFTLYANTKKGNRPSYIDALNGEEAKKLYDLFCEELKKYAKVETGIFGANMQVEFTNVGPTTILLEV